MDEIHALDAWRPWLILLRTPGLGPRGLRERLAVHHGSIVAVLDALRGQAATLSDPARAWLRQPDEARLAADLAWLAEPDRKSVV